MTREAPADHRRELLEAVGRGAVLAMLALATLSAGIAAAAPDAPDSNYVLVLRPARVFTAEDSTVHAGWVVVVRGEKIAAVGPAFGLPDRDPGRYTGHDAPRQLRTDQPGPLGREHVPA